ncbi:SDR family NAD(P)-dependent oxidoreductase [Bacteriovoracaceae bacterium]|nr:SDR family NAD(P)-dependent oxidoreductase [Bacteriovoracaceae bacterium]
MSKKYALVTGSSSGLGFEIAQYLLEENFTVFGGSRRGTDISHPNFIDLELDVTSEDSVVDFFDEVGKDTVALNLIVNNAGIFEMGSVVETESSVFNDHLKTNVLGVFHILKHSFDFLIEDKTHIINISSIASKKGFPNVAAYCASKFALNGLIESTREEWKSMGIRFSNLMPGAIDTPLWETISDDFERSKMLDPDDFIHVFDMIIKAPVEMQFPEVTFLHKSGALK